MILKKKIQIIRNTVQLIFLSFLLTGLYMEFRKIFIVLLPISLLMGNFFCGWVCPYGAAQEFFGAIGNKIFKKKYKMPQNIQKYLQFSRYILMIFTIVGIGTMFFETINSYKTFIILGKNISNVMISISLIIMISFLVISMLFERPFCSYLCIEGTKYSLASLTRIFTIKKNTESCINCKKCNKVCPMNISISDKSSVRNSQCINCFECVSICPVKGTLSYGKVKVSFKKK
ncbi:4Fe-4S binding protein [Psychrilyobacter piezotolerans]|uniref:4Fe-4S binding protein n=1 Tax=Psychrilyobacter piezotolerans TaxID=2293438 RepID=A0ABX9KE52_9FUSO|nr:4Fe-4S binding protein [Psychrilyobacter sp. S5]REI39658.1 4Fe-4S binding protein [Psychrilyobacter piezotolerans]